MNGKQPRVSVIVVTYNGMAWLDQCLSSLAASDWPANPVVVDNQSTDGSPDFIRDRFPEVHLIESGANLGFGRANNLGMAHALQNGADYVFLLNQDAWVEPDTIRRLVEAARAEPGYGIVSPLHLNGQADALDYRFSVYASPPHCEGLFSDIALGKPQNKIYRCYFVNAAAWFIPRATLEAVGGFDPMFTHFGEDDNFAQRVKYHGFSIGILPLARICHDRVYSTEDNRRRERLKKNMVKYSDVRENAPALLRSDQRGHRIRRWVYRLLGKKERAAFHQEELDIIRRIEPDVARSWRNNRERGLHYLDLAPNAVPEQT